MKLPDLRFPEIPSLKIPSLPDLDVQPGHSLIGRLVDVTMRPWGHDWRPQGGISPLLRRVFRCRRCDQQWAMWQRDVVPCKVAQVMES